MSKIIVDQLNATEAFKVPTFTEAQRDALTNVQEGFLIHNSTAEQMEIYYSGDWRNPGNKTAAGGGTLTATGGAINTAVLIKFILLVLMVFLMLHLEPQK